MARQLTPGGNVVLEGGDLIVYAGWAHRPGTPDFALDLNALACGSDGRVLSHEYFVYFNNPRTADGGVALLEDETVGRTPPDREAIRLQVNRLPPECATVALAAVVYDPTIEAHNFSNLSDVFIRVVSRVGTAELVRFDVSTNLAGLTAVVLGEMYRYQQSWKFRALGQGWSDGIDGLARQYGLDL